MCNRYRLSPADHAKLEAQGVVLPFPPDENWPMRKHPFEFITRPTDPAVVTISDADKLRSTVMRWGFPMQGHNPGTNARNLSLGVWKRWAADPAYRCLVPVSAFCEFGPKAPGMKAAPQHWFGVVDQPVFFFGGFGRPDGDDRRFTFVTTGYLGDPDNHVVGKVHPKAMPLILHPEDLDRWLTAPFDELLEMQSAYPSQLMRVDA
jgi:putative SOS response-associated peptidase YedK